MHLGTNHLNVIEISTQNDWRNDESEYIQPILILRASWVQNRSLGKGMFPTWEARKIRASPNCNRDMGWFFFSLFCYVFSSPECAWVDTERSSSGLSMMVKLNRNNTNASALQTILTQLSHNKEGQHLACVQVGHQDFQSQRKSQALGGTLL